ncbi:MAG: hypothetical protein J7647_01505 [Cyanobacteria bacterium SBLK]|nr:hypothetical protein [Cyanobacteria bacterium SBLK]
MNPSNPNPNNETDNEETLKTPSTSPTKTEKPTIPWTGDYLSLKAENISKAKQYFACACYYSMLAEGLTWDEIFLPISGRLSYREHYELAMAFDRLFETIETHGIPDLIEDYLRSANWGDRNG